jgi:hypothetical protein
MTQRPSSIPATTSMRQEWLAESANHLPHRNDRDRTERFETLDAGALLTDLQRAALRWVSFFEA